MHNRRLSECETGNCLEDEFAILFTGALGPDHGEGFPDSRLEGPLWLEGPLCRESLDFLLKGLKRLKT